MDDRDLRQTVIDELDFEPSIDAAHIGVAVENGVVTLTGYVQSYAEKLTAEGVVKRVRGVKGIAEEIEIRLPNARKTADDQIAQRVLDILGWDVRVPDEAIQIKVAKGWITLTGEVERFDQRHAAENAVRRLSGVTGVSNLITVKPTVQAGNVKNRIQDALRRNAELEANNIEVSVTDGKVVLEGRVHAWHERNLAERAAWAVKGVKQVEDHLRFI